MNKLSIKMISNVALANLFGQMVDHMRVNGSMENITWNRRIYFLQIKKKNGQIGKKVREKMD